jgi:hypothetical protein
LTPLRKIFAGVNAEDFQAEYASLESFPEGAREAGAIQPAEDRPE